MNRCDKRQRPGAQSLPSRCPVPAPSGIAQRGAKAGRTDPETEGFFQQEKQQAGNVTWLNPVGPGEAKQA